MEQLICYKQMPVWTKETLPQMFQEKHNTKEGTWAKLTILKGELKFYVLTEEGDVVTTIAVAVSSITTTLILVLGMLLLTQLKPILESPIMAPAFKNILPALFGGLLVVFVAKNPKIAAVPFAFMLILFIAMPQLGKAISMLIPVGAAITIIYTRIMYKKGKI